MNRFTGERGDLLSNSLCVDTPLIYRVFISRSLIINGSMRSRIGVDLITNLIPSCIDPNCLRFHGSSFFSRRLIRCNNTQFTFTETLFTEAQSVHKFCFSFFISFRYD